MKITEFEMPLGGARGDIGRLGDWWRFLLGTVVMVLIMGLGMSLFSSLAEKIPFLAKYRFKGFRENGNGAQKAAAAANKPVKILYGVK